MKRTVAVLQGLLLVTSTYSRVSTCRKENQQALYYIYNGNVETHSFYCFRNVDENFKCENFNNGKPVTNHYQDILSKCRQKNEGINSNLGIKVKLCQVPARVNLLQNNITLVSNKTCRYKEESCYDSVVGKYVFWDYKENCQNLIRMYNDMVDVWNVGQNEMKFIRKNRVSLLLTERTKLCDTEVWKTNHNGIVVSTNYIKAVKGNLLTFQDVLPEACSTNSFLKQGVDTKKSWYIYKYTSTVTIFYCFWNYQKFCREIGYDEVNPKYNSSSLSTKCREKFFGFRNSTNPKVCEKIQIVDLMKDTAEGLPLDCKYSSGICNQYHAFWTYTDLCNSIQKEYIGYEKEVASPKHTTLTDNSIELTLLRETKLCGESVWVTDKDGLVASEKDLQFPQSTNIVFPEESGEIERDNNQQQLVNFETKPPPSHFANTASPPHNKKNKNRPLETAVVPQQHEESDNNKEHHLSLEKKHEDELSKTVESQKKEISYLQSLLRFLIFLTSLWIFWCIFNVAVNFVSLKKLNKGQASRNQAYLVNCVSQSLTTRYIFFTQKHMNNTEGGVGGVNVSVDNELYNKPVSYNMHEYPTAFK
ncbi:uncharacterized protein LOC108916321 isoform X1 [Anoplophora glabripennis]|uniref:uncharacterized protein LOC108916321 isoform X1 n=1 Tax=Anoplophora glabripennis TaxID=217634 RepID=UPI000875009D|nr:uncharacterized protein LOC108916321 isoform X1 [Anoplophora glabripennis]XP_018578052.1 uncharacterized protein LOC108916321 isoform X1 [Anoplophora glabripennis]XP_018578053.1 uncharacterized protein LOC108916321 isoform X1 [Anoplophora glabripennis]